MRELIIGIENRVREIHRAARVETVFEPERMAEVVNGFFERPLEQHVFVRPFAIELVA
jgi:hypothetical protein